MIGWQFFDIKLPLGMNPSWVLLLGAACQGFGSVAMIGCEIRTYMRLGLGYMTAVAGFPRLPARLPCRTRCTRISG